MITVQGVQSLCQGQKSAILTEKAPGFGRFLAGKTRTLR
jgi:hypothetical protein